MSREAEGSQVKWLSGNNPRVYHTVIDGLRVQTRFAFENGRDARVVTAHFDCKDGVTLSASAISLNGIDKLAVDLAAKLKKLLESAQEKGEPESPPEDTPTDPPEGDTPKDREE